MGGIEGGGGDDNKKNNILQFPLEPKALREQRDTCARDIITRFQNDPRNTPKERIEHERWTRIFKPNILDNLLDQYRSEPDRLLPAYIYAIAEEYLRRRGIPMPNVDESQ